MSDNDFTDNENNPPLETFIEPELEARIVALVLGESSDFEAEELNRLIEEKPELAMFRDRMSTLHGMLREVGNDESEEEWTLASDKREALLKAFSSDTDGGEKEEETTETTARKKPGKWRPKRLAILAAAAVVMAALMMLSLLTIYSGTRPSATDLAEVEFESSRALKSEADRYWYFKTDRRSGGAERDDFGIEKKEEGPSFRVRELAENEKQLQLYESSASHRGSRVERKDDGSLVTRDFEERNKLREFEPDGKEQLGAGGYSGVRGFDEEARVKDLDAIAVEPPGVVSFDGFLNYADQNDASREKRFDQKPEEADIDSLARNGTITQGRSDFGRADKEKESAAQRDTSDKAATQLFSSVDEYSMFGHGGRSQAGQTRGNIEVQSSGEIESLNGPAVNEPNFAGVSGKEDAIQDLEWLNRRPYRKKANSQGLEFGTTDLELKKHNELERRGVALGLPRAGGDGVAESESVDTMPGSTYASAGQSSGVQRAVGGYRRNGRSELSVEGGKATNTGSLDARSNGRVAGEVEVESDYLVINDESMINSPVAGPVDDVQAIAGTESESAEVELKRLSDRIQKTQVELENSRSLLRTFPDSERIRGRLAETRTAIEGSEKEIAQLQDLNAALHDQAKTGEEVKAELEALRKERSLAKSETIDRFAGVEAKSDFDTNGILATDAPLDVKIAKQKEILESLELENEEAKQAAGRVFPDGSIQSPDEIKQVLDNLEDSLAANENRKAKLEKQIEERLAAEIAEVDCEGQILAVNNDWSFTMINMGSENGLKEGQKVTVMRDNKKIGELSVINLQDRAAILEGDAEMGMKPGNKITVKNGKVFLQLDTETEPADETDSNPAKGKKQDSTKPFQSTVDKVYTQWGFTVIDGGKDKGVTEGTRLDVYRNGNFVAKLVVTEVEEKRSIADFVLGSAPPGFSVQKGDSVISVVDQARQKTAPQPESTLLEKSAAAEPFSTFSLHVSDVSFKLAHAALTKGEWPDPARIRIEEFVNAIDYEDPIPSIDEKVSATLEQAIHPAMQQRNLLRISLRTAEAGRNSTTPLHLTFLLDSSGSMERFDRQETLLRVFSLLARQLTSSDVVNLISFAKQPRLVAEGRAGDKSGELIQLVKNLPEEGGTNIESALKLAFEKAKEHHRSGSQSRIILLTDGAANLGDANPDRLANIVEKMREAEIAFDAAGIGSEGLNDEILEALTRKGDGRYYLLDRPEDANTEFAAKIAGSLRPAAKNVKVQVEFNPLRVGRYQLHGFEKHRLKKEDFRNDKVDAAEMSAAEAGVALYHFEPLPDGKGEVGSVSVRFRDMTSGKMVEKRWPIPYQPTLARLVDSPESIRLASLATLTASKLKNEPMGHNIGWDELVTIWGTLDPQTQRNKSVSQLHEIITKAQSLQGSNKAK